MIFHGLVKLIKTLYKYTDKIVMLVFLIHRVIITKWISVERCIVRETNTQTGTIRYRHVVELFVVKNDNNTLRKIFRDEGIHCENLAISFNDLFYSL